MICINCREANLVPDQLCQVTDTVKGEDVHFQVVAPKCPKCGYVAIVGKQFDQFAKRAADAYRTNHQLLTASQIVAAKKRLHMSWAEFANYLEVSLVQIKRWLRGDIQSAAYDTLIRLKTDQKALEDQMAALLSKLGTEATSVAYYTDPSFELRVQREKRGRKLSATLQEAFGTSDAYGFAA